MAGTAVRISQRMQHGAKSFNILIHHTRGHLGLVEWNHADATTLWGIGYSVHLWAWCGTTQGVQPKHGREAKATTTAAAQA